MDNPAIVISHPFRRLALAATIAVVAFAATACGEDAETNAGEADAGLAVALSTGSVAPGEKLEARVVNGTDQEFTYGAGYELERQVDGEFEAVQLPPRAVIQIALIAKPGEQGPPVSVEVPPQAEPGTWRVVLLRGIPGVGDLGAEFDVTGG